MRGDPRANRGFVSQRHTQLISSAPAVLSAYLAGLSPRLRREARSHRYPKPAGRLILVMAVLCFLATEAVAAATFPGRPGRVAFAAEDGGSGEQLLFDYDPRSKALRQLTSSTEPCPHGSWQDGSPSYSPDGRRIAYVHHHSNCEGDRVSRYQVRVMRSDGTRNRRVVSASGLRYNPGVAFSPNGRRIAFFHGRRGAISVYDARTSRLIRRWYVGHERPGIDWSVTGRIVVQFKLGLATSGRMEVAHDE